MININNNAGSDQMGREEGDNANQVTSRDQLNQDEGELQSLEEIDNMKNAALLNRTKSKND